MYNNSNNFFSKSLSIFVSVIGTAHSCMIRSGYIVWGPNKDAAGHNNKLPAPPPPPEYYPKSHQVVPYNGSFDTLSGDMFGIKPTTICVVSLVLFTTGLALYKSWGKQTPNLSRDEGNDASLMGEPANIVEIA